MDVIKKGQGMQSIQRTDNMQGDDINGEEKPLMAPDHMPSGLISKNVRIHQKRTSVRLEPQMWSALKEIANIENCTIHDLCTAVNDLKNPAMPFTAALRVFLMEYYRSAARTSHYVMQVQRILKEPKAGTLQLHSSDADADIAGEDADAKNDGGQ